jgi:hypothetical protein
VTLGRVACARVTPPASVQVRRCPKQGPAVSADAGPTNPRATSGADAGPTNPRATSGADAGPTNPRATRAARVVARGTSGPSAQGALGDDRPDAAVGHVA